MNICFLIELWCRLVETFFLLLRAKVVICSTIATVLTGVILRKIYLKKKQERAERILEATLEKGRRERRAKSRIRTADLTEDQKCVVCVENPKEVLFIFVLFSKYLLCIREE